MGEAASTTRPAEPDRRHRWRCAACGNLTRFDIVRTERAAQFWHVDLSGDARVEESQTLESSIESVTCRWCGRADAIEVVERPHAQDADAGPEPR
jgi:RNase P subunit RPR2